MGKAGTLTIKIAGDAGGFNKTMGNVQGKLSSFGSKAVKAGKVAAVGLSAVAVGAAALGTEVLNTGAKLTAWRQKTSTVFEGSAKDVRKWADANNEAFGVTDDELAGLAASFGDLLKPMGFTAKQAATMSKDVIGLSGALSEWSGGQRTAAEVSDILAKAMLGERDGLKELGISISAAEVQTRLLEKGQQDLTGAALQQAEAIATQELIMEKSVDAQKAYAEGGNEALRAQNGLKAGVAELREQLADRLLPIVTTITQWMADNLPAAMERAEEIAGQLKAKWDQVFPTLKTHAETLAATVETAADVIVTAVKFVMDHWDKFKKALIAAIAIMIPALASFVVQIAIWEAAVLHAWVVAQAGAIKTAVVHSAQVAVMVAKWVALAAAAALNAAAIAAAWLVSMGPIAVVVAAIAGLAYAFTVHWDTIKKVVLAGVAFIVDSFLGMAETIVGAAASAFGWVPQIGPKLREAEGAIARFRDATNATLDGIRDRQIVVDIIGRWNIPQPPTGVRAGGLAGVFHAGGTFQAPRAGGEGLALLRDGEKITTPAQQRTGGGMPDMDYWREAGREQADAYARRLQQLQRAM